MCLGVSWIFPPDDRLHFHQFQTIHLGMNAHSPRFRRHALSPRTLQQVDYSPTTWALARFRHRCSLRSLQSCCGYLEVIEAGIWFFLHAGLSLNIYAETARVYGEVFIPSSRNGI